MWGSDGIVCLWREMAGALVEISNVEENDELPCKEIVGYHRAC